jgi:hypothetical protein
MQMTISFHQLRDRIADPLLTCLTIMLGVIMFVVAPLQAAGIFAAHIFGLAFGLMLVAVVFIVSRSWIAIGAILIAITLIAVSTVVRLRHPSIVDIYIDATAWMITSLTLALVVGRAVFAPGPVSYHRIIGAVLFIWILGFSS